MITILDEPKWMKVEDANKELYPNSYVMTHCKWVGGDFTEGYLVAYALPKNGGDKLFEYMRKLCKSGEHGEVGWNYTQDPLDGGSMLYELHLAD